MAKNFHRKILKNGMTVLFEKRDIPVVSIAFAVRSGGINEDLSEKGISHFIEHLLYKGTKKRDAKKIAEEIEKNGGELNGFTGEEITAFWCKIPSKHIGLALDVLSDMIKNPLLDKKELEKEREVIFEEIKMHRDSPRLYVLEKIQGLLYSGTLGKPLIGDYKTMQGIDRQKILKKFRETYRTGNLILCVVGNADFNEIVNFAEKNFKKGKSRVFKLKIILKTESKIEKRKGIDQANMIFAYHVPLATDKKNYVAQVLSALMTRGMSSRLFTEIREKRNLAYTISGGASINKNFSHNIIYAGAKKENVEKIKKLILKEFEKVSKNLKEKELRQVQEQIIGNHQIAVEDSQDQMVNLLAYELFGDAREFYDFEKNILEVKLKDVKNLAKIKKYSFFALVPEE